MSLTGNWTLAIAISAAVAAVVAVVFCWDRVSRQPWLRWPARASMLIACQLTACLVVALFVNDQGLFYTSWSDLFGSGSGTSTSQVRAGAYDHKLAAPRMAAEGRSKGLVVPVPIPEAGGSRSNTALVYLPPQYFERAYANRAFPVFELLGGYPREPAWLDRAARRSADRRRGDCCWSRRAVRRGHTYYELCTAPRQRMHQCR
jgi:hypothetical protein